ncbi:uncharacterized protein EKO05_0002680 [Ascochyta rabiei]|uniref:Uncharacterized protein n=1 Tax=Didymella rabiei TaxID=5454 RepID=A0A163GLP9_DIDRA|nr:uncharacterized protein EKO05_0002680 [Ascochyta rabiei]KZM24911.1 hypothetical protein ST47_g3930 [Ascochyta rabiei]UPX12109.1 hypothetical protein EKO05_0002680 [Ascochyta rabiei]
MPPNRTAQTSTEVKKAYKKNGAAISERTHKQLQRGHDLEERAAREREAEKRRKAVKEKREERERKEKAARQQLGVGLATQMIGYSHTQAHLKKGMEAFLGVNKKRQDDERTRREMEARSREEELSKKLEAIAQNIEEEPFDDDDMEDVMLHLPVLAEQCGESWDEDLDDNTLLEVHDLVMSDPIEEPAHEPISVLPCPATAQPTPQAAANSPQPPNVSPQNATTSSSKTQLLLGADTLNTQPPKLDVGSGDMEFTRTHGPINKAVEAVLGELPGETIELLSQDTVALTSDWNPAQGLLYKLNPLGLPPHRLRVKVGCVVVCLRDLNTSSQLSKSQHVRVLRVENERLDCLTLDGQLAGTQTVITRVPFPAKYRNDDRFPFTRTQYPVRVATDYALPDISREPAQPGFKLPSINGRPRPSASVKMAPPPSIKPRIQASSNPGFKFPGIPASKVPLPKPSAPVKTTISSICTLDGWDDFLESGTQIARELSAETTSMNSVSNTLVRPSPIAETSPPFSTQDLDFSLDDLEDEPQVQLVTKSTKTTEAVTPTRTIKFPPSVRPGPLSRTANIRRIDTQSDRMPHLLVQPQKSTLLKSKKQMEPPPKPTILAKKPCAPASRLASPPLSVTTATTSRAFDDFGMSTQDATSFFDDDDDLAFGSPSIAV